MYERAHWLGFLISPHSYLPTIRYSCELDRARRVFWIIVSCASSPCGSFQSCYKSFFSIAALSYVPTFGSPLEDLYIHSNSTCFPLASPSWNIPILCVGKTRANCSTKELRFMLESQRRGIVMKNCIKGIREYSHALFKLFMWVICATSKSLA